MTLNHPDHSSKDQLAMHRRQLVEEETSRKIIGAFYHVWNILGFGFLESTYARAFEITLTKRGLTVAREQPIEVFFEGERVGFLRAACSSSGGPWWRSRRAISSPMPMSVNCSTT
jgi:hypothetical protein